MSIRDDFFAAKAKGSLWDVAVSIKRGNPLPLDADSIFESYAALEAYAADVLAYPGQLVAVVNADSTGIYYLDQNLAIQPVGVIPTGDSKTIEVTEAGAISLLGAAGAANGTLPMIDAETGKLVWKTLEDIGAGDGNDNTTYAFKFENDKIVITPSHNGIAQDAIELDLSDYVTSDEFNTVIGKAAEGETAATGLYKVVADALAEAKQYADDNDANDNTEYHLEYDSTAKEIKLVSGADSTKMAIDATPFIKDGMLNDVEYDADSNTLTFTWNTDSGEKTDTVVLSDIIEPYTAGNGIQLSGNEFSVKVADGNESFLTVDANGVKLSGVQSAINAAQNAAETAAATDATAKANQALTDAKAHVAENYATKEFVGEIPTGYTETNVVAYIDKKAQEVLDSANGSSSEAAASVEQKLTTYKSENDPKVKALLTEVWGSETYTGDSRIDALEAVGAQANVLENVKAAEGAKLTVSGIVDKTITIDDSGLQSLITEAKTQADKGVTDAGKAQAAAEAAQTTATGAETQANTNREAIAGHLTRITALENADVSHKAEYEALSGIVQGHTSTIAGLAKQTDLNTVSQKASANESAIETLQNTVDGHTTSIQNNTNAITLLNKTDGTVGSVKKTVDDAIAGLEGVYVPVQDGYSLMPDSEITRLSQVHNYDDSEITGRVGALETASAGYALTTDVNKKFENYKTSADQKLIDDEQDRRLGLIESDYVKAADIAGFETKTRVQEVADDLAGYKTSNNAALAEVKTTADTTKERVDAFLSDEAQVEGAIDTLVEIRKYMTDDTQAFTQLSEKVTKIENGTTATTAGDLTTELETEIKGYTVADANKLGGTVAANYALKTDAQGYANTAEQNVKDFVANNYASKAQGALADTAVQPGDLTETLKGYYTIIEAEAAFMNATETDAAIDAKLDELEYASPAQGALADTAVQDVTNVANNGLILTKSADKKISVDWDPNVTFVFYCGTATELVD